MTLADSCQYTQPVVPRRHKRRGARLLLPCFLAGLVLTLIIVLLRSSVSAHGQASALLIGLDPTHPSADASALTYPNCRFGIGQINHPLMSYSISSLNLGWYLNWGVQVNPPRPGGVEYAQLIHVGTNTYVPSGTVLANAIAANPGALWLIGNEPDRIGQGQDDVLPQDYARAYHDAYTFIKAHDPTARVAAGGIVQPTPVRMQYLDIVLDTYSAVYGMSLPTDAWSIHSFILREASCAAYPDSCWGAEVPRGISATHGILYTLDDIDNLDIFRQRIIQFRQWMKDRGYRNVPLLITEYGTVLPYYDPNNLYYDSKGRPFDEARARDFMYGTFDFMRTVTDSNVGYPADEDRLVQRWLWYSSDDTGYGGALFNPYSFARLQLGADYAAYTGAITPTVDLLAVDVMQIAPVPFSPTDAVTITLRASVSNVGNISVTEPISVRFLDGSGTQIGADQIITWSLAGCADVQRVTVTWSNVPPGAHPVRVVVDPENLIRDNDKGNNQVTGVALVALHQVFLPLVSKR
jgi:hypothetical protein